MADWWISTGCYGCLVNFSRVLWKFVGFQTSVMADWWISTGCYGSLVYFIWVLWDFFHLNRVL
jgi:hypothetical protein